MKKQSNGTVSEGGPTGPLKPPGGFFGILNAAISGQMNAQAHLKRDLGYFLVLHLFSLILAFLSAWLGYTRTLSFCSDFDQAETIALGLTLFIAGSAYIFVSRALGQLGYCLQGGKFSKAQWIGVLISLLLALCVISLDLYVNFSSVEPVADKLTEDKAESQSEAIMTRYDSLLSRAKVKIEEMEQKHFTHKGKLYIPDQPTRWVSQEILDEYAALQHELTQLRSIKTQELANDAQKVASDQARYQRERSAKVDVLSLLVGLIYFLMMLAAIRAGMYSGAVWKYFEEIASRNEESPKTDTSLQEIISLSIVENTPPVNGAVTNPRGINMEKYQRFLEAATVVLEDRGRYVKTDIARISGLARDTVAIYLKHAVDKGDLKSK